MRSHTPLSHKYSNVMMVGVCVISCTVHGNRTIATIEIYSSDPSDDLVCIYRLYFIIPQYFETPKLRSGIRLVLDVGKA